MDDVTTYGAEGTVRVIWHGDEPEYLLVKELPGGAEKKTDLNTLLEKLEGERVQLQITVDGRHDRMEP